MDEFPMQVLKWEHSLTEIHLIFCPKLIFFLVPTSQAKHWFLLGNSNSNLYYWIELWLPVGLIWLWVTGSPGSNQGMKDPPSQLK